MGGGGRGGDTQKLIVYHVEKPHNRSIDVIGTELSVAPKRVIVILLRRKDGLKMTLYSKIGHRFKEHNLYWTVENQRLKER